MVSMKRIQWLHICGKRKRRERRRRRSQSRNQRKRQRKKTRKEIDQLTMTTRKIKWKTYSVIKMPSHPELSTTSLKDKSGLVGTLLLKIVEEMIALTATDAMIRDTDEGPHPLIVTGPERVVVALIAIEDIVETVVLLPVGMIGGGSIYIYQNFLSL
jgi:hypothetical protein